MSSGMNTEQAKEYAKSMTYREAVSNAQYGKGIKYRKATMIKLRELAEIADRLDRKTEPQTMELIDADRLRKELDVDKYGQISTSITKLNIAIERSKVDAVEVVRCRECKHKQQCRKAVEHITHEPTSVTIGYKSIDFCSYGKRRTT